MAKTQYYPHYGTDQTAHPGTGRSQRKNLPRVLLADDWASQPDLQRSLYENPAAVAGAVLYQATGLLEHQLGMGRDGGGYPQPGLEKGALLHVRRVFRQMARCRPAVRPSG